MSVEKLSDIAEACNAQLADTESVFTLPVLVTTMDSLPAGVIDGAIQGYQSIIRNNLWAFPTIPDVNYKLWRFLDRWHSVHQSYIGTAVKVPPAPPPRVSINVRLC